MSSSMRRISAITASIAACPLTRSPDQSSTYTRVPMIASVRSSHAPRAGSRAAGAADGAGTVAQVEARAALPGKKPLIRRSFRPPNFETPLADLAAPLTDNGAFFVRYHLAVIPRIDPDSWRLQVSGASVRRAL